MGASVRRRIDEKGRVTIPQSIREAMQIDPGEEVAIDVEDGRIVIQPKVARDALVDRLAGCVNEETRADDAEPVDPTELKADWTSDLS